MIVDFFKADHTVMQGYKNKLIITGQDDTPIEISPCGTIIGREDHKTKHKEADVIVVAQAINAAEVEIKKVVFVADIYRALCVIVASLLEEKSLYDYDNAGHKEGQSRCGC